MAGAGDAEPARDRLDEGGLAGAELALEAEHARRGGSDRPERLALRLELRLASSTRITRGRRSRAPDRAARRARRAP